MLNLILEILFGSLIAIQIAFWPLYAFLVLPTLGDREVKVEYRLRDVLLNTYIDKYVAAYLATLEPSARNRWYNLVLRYAKPATVTLIVLIGLSLLVGRALGA